MNLIGLSERREESFVELSEGRILEIRRASLTSLYVANASVRVSECVHAQVLGVFRCYLSSGLETEFLAYWRLYTSEAKEIADVYQKALISLEQQAAGTVHTFAVCLDRLEEMVEHLFQVEKHALWRVT